MLHVVFGESDDIPIGLLLHNEFLDMVIVLLLEFVSDKLFLFASEDTGWVHHASWKFDCVHYLQVQGRGIVNDISMQILASDFNHLIDRHVGANTIEFSHFLLWLRLLTVISKTKDQECNMFLHILFLNRAHGHFRLT